MMKFDPRDSNCLIDLLQDAIGAFNDGPDKSLLQDGKGDDRKTYGSVGEWATTHRLAVHLENELGKRDYDRENLLISVDCDYNRHRGAFKEQRLKDELVEHVERLKKRQLEKDPEKEGWYRFSVLPDIVVHQRGVDTNNCIVVEIKRASNNPDDELDCIKLRLFTIQDVDYGYQYLIGATVIAFDEGDDRRLEVGRLIVDGTGRYRAPFLDDSLLKLPFLPGERGSLRV